MIRPVILVLCMTLPVASQADIQVGVAGPMGGAIAAAMSGEQQLRGAEKALKDINHNGGVMKQKLALNIGDDACNPNRAVEVANNLASRGVVFVDGHFCSAASIPASKFYAEHHILQITPASTNPQLTDEAYKNGWAGVFRTCGRDDQQGKVAGIYILQHFKDATFDRSLAIRSA